MSDQTRPKVLLMGKLLYAREEFYDQVGALADIIDLDAQSVAEIAQRRETTYKGLQVICHFHDPSHPIARLDADFYSALPDTCSYICHFGAGYDDVDVIEAKRHGIAVSHTPGAVDDATATTAIYLILAAMRQFSKAEASARRGEWKNHLELARDPEQKVLGIVGSVVAKRLLAWDMKVIYHNRREVSPKPDFPCEYKATLEELLTEADVVSLHMPTEKSFAKDQFNAMKPGAVLVNTARGGVVDEEALINALRDGKLYGAGLDVFPDEPNINPELLKFDNVSILPHMGTETSDSRHKMGIVVLQNVLDALSGKTLRNLVPEHRL
ncbi:hypothetical protein FFLO_05445 [Filobasidium floriforme]|uniref:Uncharacterized protein n=1 Tax=Filobasidium floriforme TaxID=5210 RepID=A0A8K0NNY0_9TREE|nr:D-isomer specific 2-hydroxyacid dehydrogenase [Filobasidium floriforme]KAG7529718.1 hypothetical protein FFLO_05445 [Filobasidium floriforme]KAH8079994.1 D-isomer specific 2-hydroxyacid dehydrogenase [Filobasidium floriforme]